MRKNTLPIIITILLVTSLMPQFLETDGQLEMNQDQMEINPITGYKAPFIDGILAPDMLEADYLGEWEDAKVEELVVIADTTDQFTIQQYSKMVGDSLYLGMKIPTPINVDLITQIAVQIDRDLNSQFSKGDVLLVAEFPFANTQKVTAPTNIQVALLSGFVYDGSSWNEFTEVDEEGIEQAQRWGNIQAASSTFQDDYPTHVELGVHLREIDESLVNYPSNRPNHDDATVGYIELQYGLIIQTPSATYGYPMAPVTDINDLQPAYVTGPTTVYYEIPPINVLPSIDLGVSRIELTQSTQTATSSYSIIEGKEALARVFVEHDQTGLVRVEVTLEALVLARDGSRIYLQRLFIDRKVIFAPASPVRQVAAHSANFELNGAITNSSTLLLRASVELVGEAYDPVVSNNQKERLFFLVTSGPFNVYIVPINNATSAAPNLPTMNQMNLLRDYMEMMYPISSINYIVLDWREFGIYSGSFIGGIVGDFDGLRVNLRLTEMYNTLIADQRASPSSLPYPHQLHGIARAGALPGGGLAHPTWSFGNSKVAWSTWGSSRELTMAHEINHNLGPGTWGRHVTGSGYGCGAPDGLFSKDGDWDSLYGDNVIHDIGWNRIDGLIGANTFELMTYCQSPTNPVKWLGGYRWERLLDALQNLPGRSATGATVGVRSQLGIDAEPLKGIYLPSEAFNNTVRLISGYVTKDGNGALLPSFEQNGIFNASEDRTQVNSTDIQIEIEFKNGSMSTIPLGVTFTSIEEEQREIYFFSEMIQDNGQIVALRLMNTTSNSDLSSLKGSGAGLQGEVFFPVSLKRTDKISLKWDFYQTNTTTVHSKVMYSPDGLSWQPISQPTTDSSAEITLNSLPGGETAQLGLLVTDGLETRFFAGPQYFVEAKAPEVRFLHVNQFKLNEDITVDNPLNKTQVDTVVNGTTGSTVSFNVQTQDQYNQHIGFGNYEWTITDSSNIEISRLSGIGAQGYFKFEKPGNYTVIVKVTDPNSGISTTSSIKVEIHYYERPHSKAEFQKFTSALQLARENYVTIASSDSSISSTSEESQTTSTTQDSENNNGDTTLNVLPFSYLAFIVGLMSIPVVKKQQKRIIKSL